MRASSIPLAMSRMDGVPSCGSFSSDQRPAVVRVGRLAGGLGGGGFAARIHQCAELVEAVGSSQAGGGELPERVRRLLASEAGDALQVVGEAGSALLQQRADAECFGRERGGEQLLVDGLLRERVGQPVGGLADVEGDGRGVGGDHAAGRGAVAVRPGGVRRDAAPADGAGEAKLVEPAGIVVGDAGGQQGALPLDGRGFEAFELVQGGEHALFAGELRLRREMLPAEQPAHVDRGRDGLDLLARGGEGEAVDALQDAALAPFDLVVVLLRWRGCSKAPRISEALHLHREESLEDCGGVER